MKPEKESAKSKNTESFNDLLGEVALRLLGVRSHKIDSEIYRSLMRIGEYYQLDRIDLRRFSEDRSVAKLLNWWLRSDGIGLSSDLRSDQIPWATSMMLRDGVVRVAKLSELPGEAVSCRAMMERDKVCALMMIPTTADETECGTLLFACQEEREWPDEIVAEAKILGDALAVAYVRAQRSNSLWMSESRLRAVLENQSEFIFRWLPDGTRTWVNDTFCRYLGQTRESLLGTNFLQQLEPADRERVLKATARMTPENPTSSAEFQVSLPTGETGWHLWTHNGIFDESGELIEIQSVGRDVSEQKNVETALVESEFRYRSLVENTTDWIWEMNLDFERTYSNGQLEVILGYAAGELQKLTLEQLIQPEDIAGVKEKLSNLVARKSGWDDWVLRFRHKDGSCRCLESKANPVFDAAGNLCGYRGIDRNITDEVLSKQVLARSEQKYRTVVESANDAIWLFDGKRFTDCNDKTLEILGRTRDDVIGKAPWEISPEFQPDGSLSKDAARAVVADVLDGNPRRFEWVHLRHDGTAVDMDISLTPIEITDDGARILAVGRDVSDNKRAQRTIEHRARFDSLLAELSAELVVSGGTQAIAKFDRILRRIGEMYRLSAVDIWWVSGGTAQLFERKAGWRRMEDDLQAPSEIAYRTDAPWLASQLLRDQVVQITDVDDWPDEASVERENFERWGIPALLAFPAQVREEVAGACILSASEARQWSPEELQELRLIANTASGAYARSWAVEEISRRERDLARSQEIANVGNFSLEYDIPQATFSLNGKAEMSRQCRNLFGIGDGPLDAAEALDRIHPDDRERILRNIEERFATSSRGEATYRVVRPDRTTINVRVQSEIDRDDNGKVVRFFGVVHDVTERLEANKKIEDALAEIRKLKDQLQEENVFLRQEIRAAHGFGKIVGDSQALGHALRLAEKVAPTDLSVLILGETGTGKELTARAIHDLSRRKDHALVSVNCAALSKELIESELFGHEKGAFTGAHARRKGRFEVADGGTLFLDEIGELPGELQAKLLRVLQDGSFERLGGSETLHVDVRLIAATNKDLKRAVEMGEFRADLFYRINSFPLRLPPLRERVEDIPLLTDFFVQKHAKRMGKHVQSVSPRTIRYLCNRNWPGNVRELESIVQRALISTIGPVLDYSEALESEPGAAADDATIATKAPADLRNVERQHVLNVLKSTEWVIEGKHGAAMKMGIPPSTLRSLMERLRIERPR